MFRELLSNRLIQVALGVCVLIVSGSFLYYLHTKSEADRAIAKTQAREEARAERLRQQQDTGGTHHPRPVDFGDAAPTLDAEDASSVSTDTDAARPSETDTEVLEGTSPSETDTVSADEPAEEVAVSPFGFGPYPELPADYPWGRNDPAAYWKSSSMEVELMDRVLVKIWTENPGSFDGGSVERVNGRLQVFPHYHNTAYVKWADRIGLDGKVKGKYISAVTSGFYPEVHASLAETGEIPAGFRVLDYEDSIDPYTFLELPE